MAFQDFGHLSERRRIERQQRFKKRIYIGAVSAVVVILLVAVGVFVAVTRSDDHGNDNGQKTAAAVKPQKQVSHNNKAIKTICSATDYKQTCENSLSKLSRSNSTLSQPKDLLKVAISAASDGLQKAFGKTVTFKFDTPEEKDAYEDCKVLMQNAKEELEASISQVSASNKLSSVTQELNNWLSAVMSYQATCIDGFPEGPLKTNMEKTFKSAKELTSNALAIVSKVTSILSSFDLTGANRHLLAQESSGPSLANNGLPIWMTREDRRVLKPKESNLTPNAVVAKDGSGNFTTISAALAAMPPKYPGRYVIYVKEGVYDETVTVERKMQNVTMYGEGSRKTIVTGNKNFVDGVRTFQTASFVALGDGFVAVSMGFRNTAGPEKHQAVAIRVQSDRSIFLNCRMDGYQDTVYAQTHRQFFRGCVITGTIDFIFGDASAIFQNCLITVRKPLDNQQNIVTAQGRTDKRETTGIVLQNCRILPDQDLIPTKTQVKSYLGRPWKEFSRTIVMESTIEDLIQPQGWLPWEGNFALSTLYYAEYNNKGPGAALSARVKWPGYKVIEKEEAVKYTVGPFIQGDDWLKADYGISLPVHFGLY
ncbi:putative pectinesterase/pectinesterase inhibitor 45 [Vitis riparia]|uniref:putative pectinesterase/pectinesterase inhibitor 45 n=1 Tax=Vitis riparia TaxID=96939 RepID=UPI00155A8D7C|nr:putative pectinesterase/pectinesterase inhibitor 45 [Vitis riparia]